MCQSMALPGTHFVVAAVKASSVTLLHFLIMGGCLAETGQSRIIAYSVVRPETGQSRIIAYSVVRPCSAVGRRLNVPVHGVTWHSLRRRGGKGVQCNASAFSDNGRLPCGNGSVPHNRIFRCQTRNGSVPHNRIFRCQTMFCGGEAPECACPWRYLALTSSSRR